MSPSIILEKALPSEIQSAMGIALLRLKSARKLTLDDIGSVIGRSRESVSQYISDGTEMATPCWLKATARWPELHDLMITELDAAEKDAAARQRSFKLEGAA
jgi:hypothetical protein